MGEIWAITSYFNPVRYQRRLHNYRLFRQRLTTPLLTVELSFDEQFELRAGDADILVQLSGRDIMWQKERSLNVALERLPRNCEQVAWLDCDVILERADWPQQARAMLERYALVQLFDRSFDLLPHEILEPGSSPGYLCANPSLAHSLASGVPAAELYRKVGTTGNNRPCADAFAWAARRDLLETHRFYDACILGGGTRPFANAAYGQFEEVPRNWPMTARQREHYRAWALPFFETVRASIGCLGGSVFHLWHGNLNDRFYVDRHLGFRRFDFDPFEDIAIDIHGAWRWNTPKENMHRYVRDYFAARKEDGE